MSTELIDIGKVNIDGFPPSSVVRSKQLSGGGNNRVFQIDLADGGKRILKQYFSHPSDARDRLKTEFGAFQFLWANGVRCIPEPLGCDRQIGCALYSYVESVPFDLTSLTPADIGQLAEFVRELRRLSSSPEAQSLGAASEASFSVAELFTSIDRRMAVLLAADQAQEAGSALNLYLKDRLRPFYESCRRALQSEMNAPAMAAEDRTLSPSDLGFHNALRQRDGSWIFQDFEYFGWDDPAKLIVDVELHPAMKLRTELCEAWRRDALRVFADTSSIRERVEMVYPLYGVKWCIILLNEFVPHFRARRGFAALEPQELHDVQLRQLTKARELLDTLQGVQ